jgi:alpha-D-ribose 1-methylphosphonate 5-triphosphate diphosphatase
VAFSGGIIVPAAARRRIDLHGFLLLPGIVDIHGDGFERHLAPRRGAVRDLGAGLAAAEAELGAAGITTAVLAQFWSWEGGMRGPEFALALLGALGAYSGCGTDLRVQLRFETHLLDQIDAFEAAVADHGVGYVVLNDHLPHRALGAGKRPPRLTGQALKSGRSPEAHLALMSSLHARTAEVPGAMASLAARLVARGVRVGAHDDSTATQGATGPGICEFPETLEAARAARDAGRGIVMGAPNVLRGGSHAGKVSAADLVAGGLCDALASDYHYPAPAQAAFGLVAKGMALAEAWALVSARPAALLGLEDRGRIAPGFRADLVVVDAESLEIGATFAAGRITWMAGRAAERFVA